MDGFITHDNWLKLTTVFGKLFHGPVSTLQELSDTANISKSDDGTLQQAVSTFTITDSCLYHFDSNPYLTSPKHYGIAYLV